jgi:hypothetical protein
MKIRQVGAELLHADRQTDMTKLTVVFRNFANAPKKVGLKRKRPYPHILIYVLWGPSINEIFTGKGNYEASNRCKYNTFIYYVSNNRRNETRAEGARLADKL